MKRFPCLILDANIVIWLFAQGLWSAVVERCEQGLPHRLCSSDAIVFKVLSLMDRSEQGVSLEEVLHSIGLSRGLSHQFTKAFREQNRLASICWLRSALACSER
jgi:hypothetical protein